MTKNLLPLQPNNPTNDERHKLLCYALKNVNRLEDFYPIIKELSPPPNITNIASPGSFKNIKVAIIGGGLAGLSAAFELRKLGFHITIFEAQKRIGGRVYTYYFDEDKKLYGELGTMRIPISHETTWHYINLFHINTRPFIQTNKNSFIYIRNVRVRNDSEGKNVMENIYPFFHLTSWEKNTPWQDLLAYGLDTPLSCMHPSVRKESIEVKQNYHPQMKYWTYFNIRQVLENMRLSQNAIDLLGSLSPLTGSFYYNSYSEILQEDYSVDFSFLYEIIGGMVNLPLSFYRSLISKNPKEYHIPINNLGKVIWKSESLVTKIHQSHNKILLNYKNKHGIEPVQEVFDYVICAVPFSSLRTMNIYPLFSNRKMQAIREVTYTAAQKTLFLCKNRFWETQGMIGGGSYTDLPISTIWYPSTPAKSPNEPGVLLASYNSQLDAVRLGNLDHNRRFEEIKREVEAVHGLSSGHLDAIVEDYKTVQWNTESYFYGAYCNFSPEQKKLFSYAMVKPEYNNRIFFAGEHISAKHAWIQGALSSGMEAANDLARQCKFHKIEP